MKLINTDKLNRRRIKAMLKTLDPLKQFIWVRRNGLVIRKRKWWSCKREVWLVTDLFIALLPKLLANNMTELAVINTRISAMLYMSQYTTDYDIVDYLWSVYIRHHVYPELNDHDAKRSFHFNSMVNYKQMFKSLKSTYTYTAEAMARLKGFMRF